MGSNRINNQIDLTTGTSGSIFRIGWSTPTGPGGLFGKNIHNSCMIITRLSYWSVKGVRIDMEIYDQIRHLQIYE